MGKLTKVQLAQIERVIKDHMSVVMELFVGDGKPSPQVLSKLKLPKGLTDLISSSYTYGRIQTILGKDFDNMSRKELSKLMSDVSMSRSTRNAIELSRLKAKQHIDTLSQKVLSSTMTALIQSDIDMWEAVREVVPKALEESTQRYKVIQQLREKTDDWKRDWHRVAHSEMWDAKLQGEADAIAENKSPFSSKGVDTLVYKRPAPNACKKCIQLYLETDKITPKVFTLSQLRGNGTNYGKKQADWVPTLGILHPNCMCTLNVMPDGTEFDAQGNLVPKS